MATFAKEMGRRDKLVPHLNAWFSAGEFPDEIKFSVHSNKEHDDAFHPSSHSLACLRELYAMMAGDVEQEEHSGALRKIFMIGHMYHGWIQNIIVDELGFSTWDDIEKEHDEHRVTPNGNPYRVRGFTDVAKCSIPEHGDFLIDIKTVNSRLFMKDELPEATWAKYFVQCQLYLHWHGMDKALLLCVQKDSPHAFKEFLIEYDEEIVEEIYDRWETVADALASGDIPPCDCPDVNSCPVRGLYVNEGSRT